MLLQKKTQNFVKKLVQKPGVKNKNKRVLK